MRAALLWLEPEMVEGLVRGELVEGIDRLLHELCQPLTVLQCRLAMGELSGEQDAMREAIGAALGECARLNDAVSAMRGMLATALRSGE
jgi:signal transduction histidine kinase